MRTRSLRFVVQAVERSLGYAASNLCLERLRRSAQQLGGLVLELANNRQGLLVDAGKLICLLPRAGQLSVKNGSYVLNPDRHGLSNTIFF